MILRTYAQAFKEGLRVCFRVPAVHLGKLRLEFRCLDAVIVGADRIAANGDVANKIGTYGIAVVAREHGIPFYVAAPTSTIDLTLTDGSLIPIEQREAREVLPEPIEGVDVWNPAFDVTPSRIVTAIVTEYGVIEPADLKNLRV